MSDFWAMIKASYEAPPQEDEKADDHYWTTLVKWSDALGKKYGCDPILCGIIMGYLDGQNHKANGIEVTIET